MCILFSWTMHAALFYSSTKKGALDSQPQVEKVCQLLALGRWFSPGTPASSTTKTGRHDIADIALMVIGHRDSQLYFHITRYVLKRRVNIDAQEHWKHSSSKFSTISFIFVNEINIIINCTSWILNIWSLVPKRIQIKLLRVASSAQSFNLMRFAALVIIFSISTPWNYPIVVWSCD
jgi:hypothetical protein